MKVPVGPLFGGTESQLQRRMTLEQPTQLGKYFSVSLYNMDMNIIE